MLRAYAKTTESGGMDSRLRVVLDAPLGRGRLSRRQARAPRAHVARQRPAGHAGHGRSARRLEEMELRFARRTAALGPMSTT